MDDWKLKPARDLEMTRRDRHRSTLREIGLIEASSRWLWWSLVRSFLRVYHRLSIHGREHLPLEPPYLLVANHGSHLDSMCMGASLPMKFGHCTFPLAAGDFFFQNPAVAAFSALAINALPVWRKKVSKQALLDLKTRLIEDRCIYILFPEGTRSRDGEMGKFRAGFGMFVAGSDIPVVPCWIQGAHEAFPPGARFPKPTKISIHFGRSRKFSEVKNVRSGWDQIATSMEAAVRRLGKEVGQLDPS